MDLIIAVACFASVITVTSAYDCKELGDRQRNQFWATLTDGMLAWRDKIWNPASSFGKSVGDPEPGSVTAAMISAATIAAKEVCKQETKLFVSKVHLPDICRNVYVIPPSLPGLMRYRYCPNAMTLLRPKKDPVERIDRDLILQKGNSNGDLSFVMRIFDDTESKNRYVAIVYEGDKGQGIQEFVGPLNKLYV